MDKRNYVKTKTNRYYEEEIHIKETKYGYTIEDKMVELEDETMVETYIYDIFFEGNNAIITKIGDDGIRRWDEPVNEHELRIVVNYLYEYFQAVKEEY